MDYRVSDLAKAAVMLGTRFRNWAPLDPKSSATSWKDTGSSTSRTNEEASLLVLIVYRTLRQAPAGADPAGWAADADRLAARADPLR